MTVPELSVQGSGPSPALYSLPVIHIYQYPFRSHNKKDTPMPPQRQALAFFFLALLLPQTLAAADKEAIPPRWTAQEAVQFALQYNPDARAALERIHAADADIRSAKAAFYPQLGMSTAVSYTHLRAHETDSYIVCRL